MNKPPFLLPPVDLLQKLAQAAPEPPQWLRAELHNRLVLLLNHVLMQEPQAMERLQRQQGKAVHVQWGKIELWLQPTPAGLLTLADPVANPDLRLTVTEASPLVLAQQVLAGNKPPVDIQGDVQLAAEVAWLADNVRWDVEEDLSRLFGDAVAHTLVRQGQWLVQTLKGFVGRQP
jgi:ubiquinone biosynthesis accessory factor UbiJ